MQAPRRALLFDKKDFIEIGKNFGLALLIMGGLGALIQQVAVGMTMPLLFMGSIAALIIAIAVIYERAMSEPEGYQEVNHFPRPAQGFEQDSLPGEISTLTEENVEQFFMGELKKNDPNFRAVVLLLETHVSGLNLPANLSDGKDWIADALKGWQNAGTDAEYKINRACDAHKFLLARSDIHQPQIFRAGPTARSNSTLPVSRLSGAGSGSGAGCDPSINVPRSSEEFDRPVDPCPSPVANTQPLRLFSSEEAVKGFKEELIKNKILPSKAGLLIEYMKTQDQTPWDDEVEDGEVGLQADGRFQLVKNGSDGTYLTVHELSVVAKLAANSMGGPSGNPLVK